MPGARGELASEIIILKVAAEEPVPAEPEDREPDLFNLLSSAVPALQPAVPQQQVLRLSSVAPGIFPDPSSGPAPQARPRGAGTTDDATTSLKLELATNPCAGMEEKPLGQLGINIALPTGKMPDDYATPCWDQLNTAAGPFASMRHWPMSMFNWNATCLCHRPLYFEEINLERHGYGCHECLQPLASAAHFFGTVPVLPYCMAHDCPGECIYTLGHYRPGSCPPWRHHYPPFDPVAAAAQGGVLTGLILLFP